MEKLKTLLSKRLGVVVAVIVFLFVIVLKAVDTIKEIVTNPTLLGWLFGGIVFLASVYIVCETWRATKLRGKGKDNAVSE